MGRVKSQAARVTKLLRPWLCSQSAVYAHPSSIYQECWPEWLEYRATYALLSYLHWFVICVV